MDWEWLTEAFSNRCSPKNKFCGGRGKKAKRFSGFKVRSTMSQLDMESLLHYEQNLAACYEAEYILEMSMRNEHISESASRNMLTYDDASEVRIPTAHSLPLSPAQYYLKPDVNGASADGTDVQAYEQATLNGHYDPSSLSYNSTHTVHARQRTTSKHSLDSPITSSPVSMMSSSDDTMMCVNDLSNSLSHSNDLEPQRKKVCLQRQPEM